MNKKHSYVCSFVPFSCILRIGNEAGVGWWADRSINFSLYCQEFSGEGRGKYQVRPSNGTVIALDIYRQAMLQQFRYSNTEGVGGHLKQLSQAW
jgi:hypothetical protein